MFCGAQYTHHTVTQLRPSYGKLQWNTELFAKTLNFCFEFFFFFFTQISSILCSWKRLLKWGWRHAEMRPVQMRPMFLWKWCPTDWLRKISSLQEKEEVFVVVFTMNLKKHIYLTNTFWLFSSSYHSNSRVSIMSTFWIQLYVHWNILYTISPLACLPLSSTQT